MEDHSTEESSKDTTDEQSSPLQTASPAPLQDAEGTSGESVSETAESVLAGSPSMTCTDAMPANTGDLQWHAETRTSLSRAAASSPKRKRLVESCAGEKDDDVKDESYDPTASLGHKPKKAASISAAKKIKEFKKTNSKNGEPSQPATAPKKPAAKIVLTGSKTRRTRSATPEQASGPNGDECDDENKAESDGKQAGLIQTDPPTTDKTSAFIAGVHQSLRPTLRATFVASSKRHKADYETLDKELQIMEERGAALGKQNQLLTSEVRKLEADIDSISKMKPTASEEVVRIGRELMEMKNPQEYLELRVNDDVISGLWHNINHHIGSVSFQVAADMRKSTKVRASEPRFPFVLGQAVQVAPFNPYLCAAFMRNWLWRCMVESVIESDQGPWDMSLSRAFVAYYRVLRAGLEKSEISPEFVSQVKSTSCSGIAAACRMEKQSKRKSDMISLPRERLMRIRDDVMKDLDAVWETTQEDRQKSSILLGVIVEASARLGRHLLSSKAIFTIGSLDPFSIPPALGSTETRETDHIVTAPSLLKQGTADGENFGQTIFLHTRESFEVHLPHEFEPSS